MTLDFAILLAECCLKYQVQSKALKCLRAMGGTLRFEETLGKRLGLMNPSSQAIKDFLEHHPPQLSKGKSVAGWSTI